MATKPTTAKTTLAEDAATLLAATEPGAVIPAAEPLPVAQQQVPQQSAENIALSIPPVKKFYHALNSNQFKKSNGLIFSFSPYLHAGGTWMGTYVAEKLVEIEALDALVKTGVVTVLTELEHLDCLKKKALILQSLGQSLIHSEVSASPSPSASLADPLNTEPAPPVVAAPPVASVDEIAIGESKMPEAVEHAPPAE